MVDKYSKQELPDCWYDDERMNSLFSALRENREINPYDWDSKVDFWTKVIVDNSRAEKDVCIDCNTIAERFRRKGSLPLSIDRVLLEMQRRKQIQSLDDYQRTLEEGWVSWGFGLVVRKPTSWLFSLVSKRDKVPEGTVVSIDLMKEKAEEVLKMHHITVDYENTDNILEYTELWEKCKNIFKSESVFALVLSYLRKCRKICIQETKDRKKIIKICGRNSDKCSALNEMDLGIFRIKQTYSTLKKQSESLNTDIDNCQAEILAYLKKKMQKNAMNVLKKQKALQRSMLKKEAAMENLQTFLDKIQEANSNQMVIDAYQAGVLAMKDVMGKNNLTTETVDNTLLDVEEVLEKFLDIDNTFAKGHKDLEQTVLGISSDDELEKELNDLLTSDQQKDVDELEKEISGLSISNSSNYAQNLPSVPMDQLKDVSLHGEHSSKQHTIAES